jgi:hypothetical protein
VTHITLSIIQPSYTCYKSFSSARTIYIVAAQAARETGSMLTMVLEWIDLGCSIWSFTLYVKQEKESTCSSLCGRWWEQTTVLVRNIVKYISRLINDIHQIAHLFWNSDVWFPLFDTTASQDKDFVVKKCRGCLARNGNRIVLNAVPHSNIF